MKKILIIFLALSFYLNAGWWSPITDPITEERYLTVSSQSIQDKGSGTTLIDNFSIDFSTLTLPDSNVIATVDLYLKSNSITKPSVQMTISGENQIKNGEESMEISLTYRDKTVTLGEPFTLLNRREGDRDGTEIGTIEVKIENVSSVQLVGEYGVNLTMRLDGESTQTFPIKATVPTITVAGFTPTQSEVGVNEFLGARVDFGDFEFDKKNTVNQDLYIRSNSEESLYISFDTDEMVHKDDSNYKIAMKYYWDGEAYSKDREIKVLTGRDQGVSPVGTLTFETQTIESSLISGEYSANVGVTITVK